MRSLRRTLIVLLAVSGCSESLFGAAHDNHNGGTGGDGGVPDQCTAPCLADATANFDGTASGTNNLWGYLDDNRDRTWTPMTPATSAGTALVGAVNNRIGRCADQPLATACAGLPGALLVTSSGTSSRADPALAYAAPSDQVIQLVLHVNIPRDSVAQRVRLYRNSREDVLYTASAAPGDTAANTLTVDALAGDRFLVALEPIGAQGGTAAVTFSVIDANKAFPSTCQLALTFSDPSVTNETVLDECRGKGFTYISGMNPVTAQTVTGPFSYLGMGLYFEDPFYLAGSKPLAGGDRTIQLWVQNEAPTKPITWVFSDVDEAAGTGLGVRFVNPSGIPSGLTIEAAAVTSTTPLIYTGIGAGVTAIQWHFVRIVHAGGMATVCLDGVKVTSAALPGPAAPNRAPNLGRNGSSTFDDFTGEVDDVRVFSGALPCND